MWKSFEKERRRTQEMRIRIGETKTVIRERSRVIKARTHKAWSMGSKIKRDGYNYLWKSISDKMI